MAQDKQVEYLHQQASALYLQGEYEAALDAWRQLLSLDPRDERAREGARLCELLVKEPGRSAPDQRRVQRPPTPGGAAPSGVGFGMGEQLDEELNELDEMLGGAPGRDWMDAKPAAGGPAAPASGDALEFDLSGVPEGGSAPDPSEFHFDVEAPDRPAREPGSESDAFDLGEADPSSAAAEAAGATAADELQHRTNELMAEALEHYERGERDEALSALTRLTILDEHNEAALNFAAHIRSEMEQLDAPAQPGGDPAGEASDEDFSASRGAAVSHAPVDLGSSRPVVRASPAAPRPAPAASPAAPETPDEEWIEEGLADERTVASVRKTASVPMLVETARPRPNKWLILAAAGLVMLGAAYVTVGFFGGSPDEPETTAPLAAPPPLAEDPPAQARPPAPAPPVAAVPVPLSPETRAKIDELMDRADSEFEAGEFAAAVLSYNDALKLDPENEVARKKLAEAGELFREQKEKLEERATAIESFNDGDYRNALRIFYRIEPVDSAEAERLTRFKAIGWYNLGVRALMAGDCRLARSHLLESQQLDPLDRHLQHAMEMNASCFEGTSQKYFDAVRSLQLRGLED